MSVEGDCDRIEVIWIMAYEFHGLDIYKESAFSDYDGEQVDILQVFNDFNSMLHEHGSKLFRVYGLVLPKILQYAEIPDVLIWRNNNVYSCM